MSPSPYVVLVCGGRDYHDAGLIFSVLWSIHVAQPITLLVQGGANGADQAARVWGHVMGVTQMTCHADWEQYGKAAGAVRNQHMLDHAKPSLVVAFPGGRGTADMVRRARAAGVEVWCFNKIDAASSETLLRQLIEVVSID